MQILHSNIARLFIVLCGVTLMTPVLSRAQATRESVTIETNRFASLLAKDEYETKESIEFRKDTFYIERYLILSEESDPSTANIQFSADDAADAYEKLIVRYYDRLLKNTPADIRQEIIKSQSSWKSFVQSEAITSSLISDKLGEGTMRHIAAAYEGYQVNKSRAIALYQKYTALLP